MAIAFDNAIHQSNSPSGATLTYSKTNTGSNLVLFVGVFIDSAHTVSSVTYNSVAMTKINTQAGFSGGVVELWGLVGPATGVNNVVITANNGTGLSMDSCAASYTGVAQTGLPDSQGTTSASGNVTDTRTSVANNCWHIAFMTNAGNNFSAGTGLTIRTGASNLILGDGNGAITPAGSNSITGNNTGTSKSNGATFAPYTAVGPTNLKSLDTNVKANIKSYNTNVIANVKSINTNA